MLAVGHIVAILGRKTSIQLVNRLTCSSRTRYNMDSCFWWSRCYYTGWILSSIGQNCNTLHNTNTSDITVDNYSTLTSSSASDHTQSGKKPQPTGLELPFLW